MNMKPAIGFLEVSSIAKGIESIDVMPQIITTELLQAGLAAGIPPAIQQGMLLLMLATSGGIPIHPQTEASRGLGNSWLLFGG